MASLKPEEGANSPKAYPQRILERLIDVWEGKAKPLVYPDFTAK
jgi:hypothetical protein